MLSKVNSVISDCLGETVPSLFVPEPKTFGHTQACRSGKGWRFFPLYGCGKNTTPCPIAWTGYVRPVTINQAMGGGPVFSCSNPIPPVAVATDKPAEHVLSRSAGSKDSSCMTVDIIYHHPPYKAGELSGNCSYSYISLFTTVNQLIVFSAKPNICLVGIDYDFSSVS